MNRLSERNRKFDSVKCFTIHVHFTGTYLDSYSVYPGQTLQTAGDETITDVTSVDFCAQKCSKNKEFSCKSFDYCSGSNTCVLKRKHVLDVPKTALQTSDMCSHFSRTYTSNINNIHNGFM